MELQAQCGKNGRMGRVLLVDDEEQVREPISLILRRDGFEVVEAENGEQAIQALNAGDNPLMVDTILCDIRMPKINGTEAIAYFRAQYPTVPVVVMTGYPDIELAVSLMRQGVRDYLVKPVSKEELLTVVRKSVDQHVILKDQFAT
ncbi:MAG: two-component system response regulator [Nitrospiraceae bacterium]